MSESGFLLDTNVISETRRARPNVEVVSFLASIREAHVCLSALTIGELRKGVAAKRRDDAEQAARLLEWIEDVEASFGDRILPVDRQAAAIWGELSAERSRPIVDTLIAATALSRGMVLVTRNLVDMRDTGVALVDPWTWRTQER